MLFDHLALAELPIRDQRQPRRIAAPDAEAGTMMRESLPNRRASQLFDFEAMGTSFTASVSRYPDSRIAELFIDNHKAGSGIGTLVRDLAIVFSLAVQHGADAERIRHALCRDSQGYALGPLGAALDLLVDQEISEARERLES